MFFFQAEDGIRDIGVTGVQTCALPISEKATLRPEGRRILAAVAPSLKNLPNELRVEGHANHLPVTPGGPWPSNWELSAYRATTVLRALTGSGVPEKRISAAGYAATRPLVPVTDPAAITTNRRVDVVVLSRASAEANALLPGIEEHTSELQSRQYLVCRLLLEKKK